VGPASAACQRRGQNPFRGTSAYGWTWSAAAATLRWQSGPVRDSAIGASHDRDLRHARLRNRWMRIAVRANPCSLADFPPADQPGAASLTASQDQVLVAKAARVTATTMPAGQPAELTSPSPKHVRSPHAPYPWVTRRPGISAVMDGEGSCDARQTLSSEPDNL
jgi:hypothetical protein